jgi:hypothetical protein
MSNDDIFAEQVHGIVRQIGEWMRENNPNTDQLMPALAVVLGRLIGRRAQTEGELHDMLKLARDAIKASATESMSDKHRSMQ